MRLRPLMPKDAQGMLSWMHDESINQIFAADFATFSEEKVLRFIESARDETLDLHRACVDDADEYLGTVSLKHIDPQAKNAEYAISFCKKAQGVGAAAFATREILRIGFEELGLERIYLNVLAENTRADRFYQKFGFVYEGTFVRHIYVRGERKDLKWYRMLKSEWKQLGADEKNRSAPDEKSAR